MKVGRSLIPPEKSYSQLKNEKIEKNKKTAPMRFDPQIYISEVLCSPTELQS